jgi:hypothetical protein
MIQYWKYKEKAIELISTKIPLEEDRELSQERLRLQN